MRQLMLILSFLVIIVESLLAQEVENLKSKIDWKKVVLKNYATFKSRKDLDCGAAFLIKYNTGIIACTARDFTGTIYTPGRMLLIKDFDKELISWIMYLPDDQSKYILMDTLALKDRIEKNFSILYYSRPFLTFALKNIYRHMIPLEPDINRIKNKDTVFLVGYDNYNQLKIVRGIVTPVLNGKYADDDIRIKTNEYLNYADFVGSPIIDKDGKAIGVFNRAYRLKIDKRGRIINENKRVDDSHFEYFVNGTSMRSILGKDYGMQSDSQKMRLPQ